MDLEKTARKYIQDLKGLYVNVSIYGTVFIVCLLIYFTMGGSGFWPIWVFIGFVAAAVLQSLSMGEMKQLEEILPFLKSEWEEQQVQKLLKKPKGDASSHSHDASKVNPTVHHTPSYKENAHSEASITFPSKTGSTSSGKQQTVKKSSSLKSATLGKKASTKKPSS